MAKPEVRLTVVTAAFAVVIGILVARAAQVQLVNGAEYATQAESQRTETVVLPARRGALYDRNGVPVAVTQESFHVGIAPNEIRDTVAAARLINTQLGISEREVRRALRRPWAHFQGPFNSAQVHPLRRIRGIHLTPTYVRFHPDPDLASAVIGSPAGEGRPAGGIELVFDSLLAGRPGRAVVIRDGQGSTFESPSRLGSFPVPGHDVILTIDVGVQEIVETALADAIARFDAAGGDVVVVEPRSGEILAVASLRADGSAPASVFTSPFEPGSTAKVFAAAALLTHARVEPADSVYGEGGIWVLPHRTLEDDDHIELEWMTLVQAIQVSSNIATVKYASRLTTTEQYAMMRDFGLGTPTGVEFPTESRGILNHPRRWSGTTPAAMAIGYEVAVTPLQLALAYAAIANDGVLLRPTLVKEIRGADGEVVSQHRPEPIRRVVTPVVAAQLRDMLRRVVTAGGTGASAALSTYEIAGKTGTARVAGPGGYIPGSHVAVFASIFPADDPQLVMVVKLDQPRGTYATFSAAPLTRSVVEQVLAARTDVLDRRRLANRWAVAAPQPELPAAGAAPRYVLPWPQLDSAVPASPLRVPDVIGMPVREAVRVLHRRGLNVQLTGFGWVVRSVPASGDSAAAGTAVEVYAAPGGGS